MEKVTFKLVKKNELVFPSWGRAFQGEQNVKSNPEVKQKYMAYSGNRTACCR